MKKLDLSKWYEKYASGYDKLARKPDSEGRPTSWFAPEFLFGLHFRFVKSGEKLLDLGVGTGLSSEPYHKAGLEVHGIDNSEAMLDVCRQKQMTAGLEALDFNELGTKHFPHPQDFFDHAIATGLLYHFRDLVPIFRETERVLKPEGTFAFLVEDSEGEDIGSKQAPIGADIRLSSDEEYCEGFSHSQNYIENLAGNNRFEMLLGPVRYNPLEEGSEDYALYVLQKK